MTDHIKQTVRKVTLSAFAPPTEAKTGIPPELRAEQGSIDRQRAAILTATRRLDEQQKALDARLAQIEQAMTPDTTAKGH
jgi:hypothetical protein